MEKGRGGVTVEQAFEIGVDYFVPVFIRYLRSGEVCWVDACAVEY
jgi:hypothetical protein